MELMNLSKLTICYGMTETSPVTFMTKPDDSFDKKTGSVGMAMAHTEGKLVDENGEIVPVGEPGEILSRGYAVMNGYWGDEKATSNAIDKDGWMHTGDIGVVDSEGYLNVTGRIKDLIIRGGENISPKEIEEYFLKHKKILDIQIFGYPDKKFGEEIFAWVKTVNGQELTKEELFKFCKGKIAYFKTPKYFKMVEEFPLTVTGKIQKFRMTDSMVEEVKKDAKSLEKYQVR